MAEVHPSPFDGLVHQLTEASRDRGARHLTVACGAEMPTYVGYGPLGGASGFPSDVTCPACASRLSVPHPVHVAAGIV